MTPHVSVIMPVFNQEQYITETIESVLNQTFSNFEFIILDDGSVDDSAKIIREFANKDSRITALFDVNRGQGAATNALVAIAKSDWCIFLDADDVMLLDRIEKQVLFHSANPGIDASSSHMYYMDENSKVFGVSNYPFLKTVEECIDSRINKKIITCWYGSLMISKESFIDSGGLRTDIWPGLDLEFFHRFIDKGFVLVVIQDALTKYRIHSSSITNSNPIATVESISYVHHCINLRRAGKPEITRKEFDVMRANANFIKRLNRIRYSYAQALSKRASFAIMKRNFVEFSYLFATASILSPSYSFALIANRLKR